MSTKVVALNSVEMISRHRLEIGGRFEGRGRERGGGWGKTGESVHRQARNR